VARMAFEPGRGRTAVPVRSALAGIAVAATAVTAAVVFGSSLLGLVGTPHRYGQDWREYLDLRFGGIHGGLLERVVSAQPGVTGYAIGDYGQVRVNGAAVSAIGLTPVRGRGYLTMLAGRPPASPGEIVLGARTLRALDLHVGQTAQVAANGYGEASAPRPMRVVGEAVFASLGRRGSFLGTDLGNGAAVVPSVLSVPNPASGCVRHSGTCYNFALLRYRRGTSLAAASSRLSATVARMGCPPGSCGVGLDQRPGDIQSYTGVRDTPLALGTVLALLGASTLGYVLFTSIRRRRRDLAILKTLGLRRPQVLAVVEWQAATLTAASLAAGLPLGVIAGRWSWSLFADSIGVAGDPAVPVPVILLVAAGGLLLAGALAAVPGRAAARVRPAAVLRTE
ncbi:MAG: ABC transporter permease, partial [Actinobacteria bacterium]|nr:ABC transporter permease [Actinomycetota bacterium]